MQHSALSIVVHNFSSFVADLKHLLSMKKTWPFIWPCHAGLGRVASWSNSGVHSSSTPFNPCRRFSITLWHIIFIHEVHLSAQINLKQPCQPFKNIFPLYYISSPRLLKQYPNAKPSLLNFHDFELYAIKIMVILTIRLKMFPGWKHLALLNDGWKYKIAE